MQIGNNSRKRSPWWCWLVAALAASVVLPGAALVGGSEAAPDGADKTGQSAAQGAAAPGPAATRPGNADSPESQVVTVRVTGSVEGLHPGQSVEIAIAEAPRVDPADVLARLPAAGERNVPFVTEVRRDNLRIASERVGASLGRSRLYPLVGPARLWHSRFRCLVRYDRTTRSDWPIPFSHVEPVEQVVYVDQDRLLAAVDPSRPLAIERVQFVSAANREQDGGREIRVAAGPGQARRFAQALEHGRLLVIVDEASAAADAPRTERAENRRPLSSVVIAGNKSIAAAEILKRIGSRPGEVLDRRRLEDDVRALREQRWFRSVETEIGESSDGPVLIFQVTE